MIQFKETKKLFFNKYKYKIVLICQGCYVFRSNDWDRAAERLRLKALSPEDKTDDYVPYFGKKPAVDINYCYDILDTLRSIDEYALRVENPWLTIYSNNKDDIDTIANLNPSKVKYVCIPYIELSENVIVMNDTPFQYRVTIGRGTLNCSSFVDWANNNKNVRLTRKCQEYLLSGRPRYNNLVFYITGDNNLLLAKIHLGSNITKIEHIVNHDTV